MFAKKLVFYTFHWFPPVKTYFIFLNQSEPPNRLPFPAGLPLFPSGHLSETYQDTSDFFAERRWIFKGNFVIFFQFKMVMQNSVAYRHGIKRICRSPPFFVTLYMLSLGTSSLLIQRSYLLTFYQSINVHAAWSGQKPKIFL